MPTSPGVRISFAKQEAKVRDNQRIGGDQLDNGEDPRGTVEQEMGEPLDAEQPDTDEENLEPMPETDEPLDIINKNEIEMPEARPKRMGPEDEEIEDPTKKVRREPHLA